MKSSIARRSIRRRQSGGSLAEFGPVLGVLFVVVLLPLIGLFSFVDGAATLYFAANAAARSAGPAATLTSATQIMKDTGGSIINGPFGAFANISPHDTSGLVLKVVQIPINATNASQGGGGVEQDYSGTPDTDQFIYEYRVTASYGLSPLFIPGGPFNMEFVAASTVEHPEGLAN